MDSIKREIIKQCIQSGLRLRKDILANKYLDGEIPYLFEIWLRNVMDELSTLNQDLAKALGEQAKWCIASESKTTKLAYTTLFTRSLETLENMLTRKGIPSAFKFSLELKSPHGVIKTTLELIYDVDCLYDANVQGDRIRLRKGLGKDILTACFNKDGDTHRKLLERELPNYNSRSFPKAFNTLQHSWADAFMCSRDLINTLIFRENGHIHISESIRAEWSL